MSVVGRFHARAVLGRRVRLLADHVAELLPRGAKVLDIGCGSGALARRLMDVRPDVTVEGIDVLVRPGTLVPVAAFDGRTAPAASGSFDAALLVDVLHHTEDPTVLLREAARVAPGAVIVKDHLAEGRFDRLTLRAMDWVGNAHHGVVLPFNYWPADRWRSALDEVGLRPDVWRTDLGLYPRPLSALLDRRLHVLYRSST